MHKPGCSRPTCSQYSDSHQAYPQVPEPGTKRLPDSHGLRYLLVEIHCAIWTVFDLGTPPRDSDCRWYRNRLADPSATLAAPDKQKRESCSDEAEQTDKGKEAWSSATESHVTRGGDERPGCKGNPKSPPHATLNVIANSHRSLPGGFLHRPIKADSAVGANVQKVCGNGLRRSERSRPDRNLTQAIVAAWAFRSPNHHVCSRSDRDKR